MNPTAENYKQKWQKCLEIIRDNVGQDRFDVWFACAREVDMQPDGSLVISLPSHFFYEKYEDDFCEIISRALQRVFGRKVPLKYSVNLINNDKESVVTMTSPNRSPHSGSKFLRQMERPVNPIEEDTHGRDEIDSQLNNTFTFDNYCVGNANKLAYTIAEYIAKNPSRSEFNPFFLYGDVGVGKTHLAQAIGNYIKDTVPGSKVLFIPMRQFQYLLANATIKKQVPAFINWFERMDALLIDDLQELSHKDGTMNALFPIFNTLYQKGKKLIFTCDRPPVELDGITDRLIDRFKWGVTERLPKPDYLLRKAILEFKARKNGLDIPENIIELIAETSNGSVRELEGIVMGLLTRSISTGGEITLELAEQVMNHSIRKPKKKLINFDMIVEATAECFCLNADVIFSKSRVREIAEARQMIMYLTKKYTTLSLPAIGMKLNRRHTTVLHDIKIMKERIPVCKDLAQRLGIIEAELNA